jgi:hypothetical protein
MLGEGCKLFCFKPQGRDESREVRQTRLLFAWWISIIWGQLHDPRFIIRDKVIVRIDFMVLLKCGVTPCSAAFDILKIFSHRHKVLSG